MGLIKHKMNILLRVMAIYVDVYIDCILSLGGPETVWGMGGGR